MTERSRQWVVLCVVVAPLLLAGCGGAPESPEEAAAQYPRRPITWIVPFDPGGGSDVEARRVQQALQKQLGTSIQIQYRSGGGGAVGWTELVKQRPDGYTVGGLVIPHIIIQPMALTDAGYTADELRPVAWNVSAPSALLVTADGRFKTMQDFMAYAKANPNQVTVGGVETFSASDLALAELVASSGIKVRYVPITGGAGPLLTSLRGNHVDAIMLSTAHAVRTEGVVPLAVAGEERFKTLPDVPTFKELGYDVTIAFAWGVGMPASTPEPIAAKFGNAVMEVMKQPGIEESLLKEGLLPVLIGPDRAAAYVNDQRARYERLVPLVRELSQ